MSAGGRVNLDDRVSPGLLIDDQLLMLRQIKSIKDRRSAHGSLQVYDSNRSALAHFQEWLLLEENIGTWHR